MKPFVIAVARACIADCAATSHTLYDKNVHCRAAFTVPALVPSVGGDSTLLPGRTPLSPGGQMRQLYDINRCVAQGIVTENKNILHV